MHLHEAAPTDHRQIFELLAELPTFPFLLDFQIDTVLDQLCCLIQLGLIFAQTCEDLHPATTLFFFDLCSKTSNDHLCFDNPEEVLKLRDCEPLALTALSNY